MDPFALLDGLDGDGDSVLSPYGIHRALDAVRGGARGEARAALDAVLGPDGVAEVQADGLALAQAAWLRDGYTPGPALTLHTGPLDPSIVNTWARVNTDGMIPKIVERFDPNDVLVITDAAFLDKRWATPFKRAGTRPFEGAGDVEMIGVSGTFEHADGAIRLPYEGEELRFVAMLGDWREVEWRRGTGSVELPAFSIESKHKLAPQLKALGLGAIFRASHDLDELVSGAEPLAVASVDQRARVDVDEHGTRAAAVTSVGIRRLSLGPPPFELIFDRPFTWAVEHAPTGTLLFVGRVRHPRERSH